MNPPPSLPFSSLPPPLSAALDGALLALLLALAVLLWRERRTLPFARLGAALALGTCAYVLQPPDLLGPLPWWRLPLVALNAGNGLVFWLFTRQMFDDGFRLRPRHGVAWALLAGLGVAGCAAAIGLGLRPQTTAIFLTALPLCFALLALARCLHDWSDDLVESRRRLRRSIVAGTSLYVLLSTATRLAAPAQAAGAFADHLALLLLATLIAAQLLRVNREAFAPTPTAQSVLTPSPTAGALVAAAPAQDPALLAALDALMQEAQVYLTPELSIGALAERLDVPEYRLRRAINQGLGYRNFNAFLNQHRIEAAKRMLRDPATAADSILDIAMACGFQSLGPFNRAFKALTGTTPSGWRRQSGDEILVDSGVG
ncbi:helix-turn-helix domain-containing protein [Niveibacterium sp. SC-1]|uniref:AraC family transcriptional regulator n=1 Tax=Niveibacterium sp. SC-1 TaxID=3135646 RepID=UPI00311DB4D6